jgi:hypothetical protein
VNIRKFYSLVLKFNQEISLDYRPALHLLVPVAVPALLPTASPVIPYPCIVYIYIYHSLVDTQKVL